MQDDYDRWGDRGGRILVPVIERTTQRRCGPIATFNDQLFELVEQRAALGIGGGEVHPGQRRVG